MSKFTLTLTLLIALAVAVPIAVGQSSGPAAPDPSKLRTESFDGGAPGFGGQNNRYRRCASRVQDFGISSSSNKTGRSPEVGGTFTNSYARSHYSRAIEQRTLDNDLRAEGRFRVSETGDPSPTAKIGFFNSRRNSVNDSPLPSSLFVSLTDKRGGDPNAITIELEAASSRGARISGFKENGGNDTVSSPDDARPYPMDQTYDYELTYDPDDGDGGTARLEVEGGDAVELELPRYFREDNASFDRYGMVNGAGLSDTDTVVHLSDISVNKSTESESNLRRDWTGYRNRGAVKTCDTQRAFDFGYDSSGRIGGLLTAPDPDDEQAEDAFYANGLPDTLDFNDAFYMKARLRIDRLSQDSSSFIGWFGKDSKPADNDDKLLEEFIGLQLRTKTRVPLAARMAASAGNNDGVAFELDEEDEETFAIRLYPGRTFDVEFAYDPQAGSHGEMYSRVDDGPWISQDLNEKTREGGVDLDYFGIHSARESGQGRQYVYLDDLTWTERQ